jgi:hypothetical protein
VRRVEKKTARRQDGKTARRRPTDGHGQTARRGDACVARAAGIRTGEEPARKQGIDPEMVEIRPEPKPSERTAILIALEQMLGTPGRENARRLSAWAQAGRREALLGSDSSSRTGWGRDSDRLAGR